MVMADDLGSIVTAYGTDDEEVRSRVRDFIFMVLDEAEAMMHEGSPPVKQGVMRSMMPHIARLAARKDEESDELVRLRNQMEELRREVRGERRLDGE